MNASGRPDSGIPDDIAELTVRAGFARWPWPFPWRPFHEDTAPEIVELITRGGAPRKMLNDRDQAERLLGTLREAGIGICAVIGNDDLPAVPGDASAGPEPSLVSVPRAAARKLGDGNAARFPLSRLVNRVVTLDPRSPDRDQVDVLNDELVNYWKGLRPGNAPTPSIVQVIIAVLRAFPNPASMLAELIDGLVRRHFRLWYWGVPGLGSECRWLRRQWKRLLPGETFAGFLLAMTAAPPGGSPRQNQARDAGKAELLAARALLEDLRVACQPRLWSPQTWDRCTRRPVLILDNLRDDRFPYLLAKARAGAGRHRGKPDPLLIVLVPRSRRGGHEFSSREVHQVGDPKQVTYQRPRRPRLAQAEFGLVPLGIAALLAFVLLPRFGIPVPGYSQHHVTGDPTASGTPAASTRSPLPAGSCQARASGDAYTQVVPWKDPSGETEHVGFSDGPYTFTNNDSGLGTEQRLQERRLAYDQCQVFAFDSTLSQLAPGRLADGEGPVYKIVYFAGLTEGPLDEYDSAEAEELEGLHVAQLTAAYGPSAAGSSVNIRNAQLEVIIANGGSKMQDAEQVAQMIMKKFANDPYFLGVAGMDRSTGQVQEAIDDFTADRIPVLATTLSADERFVRQLASGGKLVPGPIGGDSPYYFQLGSTNTDEASLIMRYIQDAVPRYFGQPFSVYPSNGSVTPQKIVIYEPEVPDPNAKGSNPDLYISSMVADLLTAGKEYHGSHGLPMPAVKQDVHDPDLCGASTVVIFAGRHDRPLAGTNDDFTTFLTRMAGCAKTVGDKNVSPLNQGSPFIIADDGVTRFIADSADRAALPQVKMPISYVSKGVNILSTGTNCLHPGPATAVFSAPMNTFCTAYAAVASGMTQNVAVGDQHPKLLWTGERVGLAYDAAQLFLQGANDAWGDRVPFTRQGVPGAFKAPDANTNLVAGSVDFTTPPYTGVDSPQGLPLAVLRIHVSDQDAPPACQFSSLSGYRLAPIPNMDTNAAACLGKSN